MAIVVFRRNGLPFLPLVSEEIATAPVQQIVVPILPGPTRATKRSQHVSVDEGLRTSYSRLPCTSSGENTSQIALRDELQHKAEVDKAQTVEAIKSMNATIAMLPSRPAPVPPANRVFDVELEPELVYAVFDVRSGIGQRRALEAGAPDDAGSGAKRLKTTEQSPPWVVSRNGRMETTEASLEETQEMLKDVLVNAEDSESTPRLLNFDDLWAAMRNKTDYLVGGKPKSRNAWKEVKSEHFKEMSHGWEGVLDKELAAKLGLIESLALLVMKVAGQRTGQGAHYGVVEWETAKKILGSEAD